MLILYLKILVMGILDDYINDIYYIWLKLSERKESKEGNYENILDDETRNYYWNIY